MENDIRGGSKVQDDGRNGPNAVLEEISREFVKVMMGLGERPLSPCVVRPSQRKEFIPVC